MKLASLFAVALLALALLLPAFGQGETAQTIRRQARDQQQKGNWKDACDLYTQLLLDPRGNPAQAGNDLRSAVECLDELGSINEFDEVVEKAVAAQPENWRVFHAAARLYLDVEDYGYLVSGRFERGYHRGGGEQAQAIERDRARALQLELRALALGSGADVGSRAGMYHQLADITAYRRLDDQSWRLQYLTDLDTLPDYEQGYGYYGESSGAPVDADGNPVYYRLPETWDAAANDGERWRWALSMAAANNPGFAPEAQYAFAEFLYGQFDARTMAGYDWFRAADEETEKPGPYTLQTLKENETIARLATGVRRFTLPDEFNYIKIYQQLAGGRGNLRDEANLTLGVIFTDRRQYDRAVEYYQRVGGVGYEKREAREQIAQILGNRGQFGPVMTQPAGKGATVEYRFRNGKKVSFTARPVDTQKLLADVQAYIKSKPKHVEWEKANVADLGYRLVTENQTKYLGKTVASWEEKLEPRPGHFDRIITLQTPLKQAGAYLLTAKMDGGNTCHIVLWVADLTIVKKSLGENTLYYVADAVTGRPVADARVNFFGYRSEWVDERKGGGGYYRFPTKSSTGVTNADGLLTVPSDTKESYNWLIVAKTGARLAYLGFTSAWGGNRYDEEYNTTKSFIITDRPVYRPGQTVKFKVWTNTAKYDQEGKNAFAGKESSLEIRNPRRETVLDKTFTADEYGGFDGEFMLEDEATLGVYYIGAEHGGASFRVEEYKKPEFAVTVDAPAEPVMLGEKITAVISAKYYFGAPVTEAKVKYKVLRTGTTGEWYPTGAWDWFYGAGYWWFAYDYPWYPGWNAWGCRRPVFSWWGRYGGEQPEVVAEAEAPIGADGTLKVPIDTALAKEMQGDTDHRYEFIAEVTDASRRTIVGQGAVLVARKPFKVYAWTDRGFYRAGDVIHASFNAQTLDHKPVRGKGELRLLKIAYVRQNDEWVPAEKEVERWELDPNERGLAEMKLTAAEAGQYRLSYKVTDAGGHEIEGGYLFTVRGTGFNGTGVKFSDIELVPDQREYQPGDKVRLLINANRADSTVLLFLRPTNGVYLPPKVIRLAGKNAVEEIAVVQKDMPNFFVEAVTIADGKVYTEAREIVVPPEKRVLNVAVLPSKTEFKPGEKATVKLRVTDMNGKPFTGSAAVSIYDKSVEYISGGGNVSDIRAFFWKWRRGHYPQTESSLLRGSGNLIKSAMDAMDYLGAFGYSIADEEIESADALFFGESGHGRVREKARVMLTAASPPAAQQPRADMPLSVISANGDNMGNFSIASLSAKGDEENGQPLAEPTVRQNFADTALWVANVETNANGEAEVTLTMPENLTAWKARVWAMGEGTQVGEGSAELTTTKDLIVRLQAPRFFTQKDEVVISANVHNYLKDKKQVQVSLELDDEHLTGISHVTVEDLNITGGGITRSGNARPDVLYRKSPLQYTVDVDANGETRIDFHVTVLQPGSTTVRVKALTDEESDAMQMSFPVYVHGMLKTESFSGAIRPEKTAGEVKFRVPEERQPERTRLEVRYSPTLAGAMVDALPYLVDYPYGCTEQTLNRFLPTVITQNTLKRMGLNLQQIQEKRTNLNAQEIGDDLKRAEDWKRLYLPSEHNPVFDEEEVAKMVKYGQQRLRSMQCADGGWGWFSGSGEQSWPHTTALVVHGLQVARENRALDKQESLQRGIQWLERYQQEEARKLKLWETSKGERGKETADALDAFVYMVLADEGRKDAPMRDYLYRDRTGLPVYAKAMFGLALHRLNEIEKRDMLLRNIEQYLVEDGENQTAYLKVGESWWCWYGSEIETDAYYLKLLAAVDPKGERASRLVKYLINNRKHATYWHSTRDTAIVIEALADYLRASGEESPNLTLQLLLDGKAVKAVTIDRDNLFSFDNKLILEGDALAAGEHALELRKQGAGPLYFNAYLTNFTLEDHITKAGLEIKVDRAFYRLVPKDKTVKTVGSRGQALDMKVEKYDRQPLADLSTVKSGDLVEVELTIESKNDYEYIIFEDMKAAGCEPVDVRSGYNYDGLRSYMELRDERVCFFVRRLPRGTHSLTYRLRAEIPGQFSALPTKASAMYAPELKANSEEMKLRIED